MTGNHGSHGHRGSGLPGGAAAASFRIAGGDGSGEAIDTAATVREYYARIDACDVDWVIMLFRSDAVYVRAEATYDGLPAIERFFRNERAIRGKHSVAEIIVEDRRRVAIATGRFTGTGRAGDARAIDYADYWAFDEFGLVVRRQTYLGTGSVYVRE